MSLLADRILYKKNLMGAGTPVLRVGELIGQRMPSTKIIHLDDSAAGLAYEISKNLNPTEIIANLPYFRLPQDRMWFEFTRVGFFGEIDLNINPLNPLNTSDLPQRMGYFLERRGENGFMLTVVDEFSDEDMIKTAFNDVFSYTVEVVPSIYSFYFTTDHEETSGAFKDPNILRLSKRMMLELTLGLAYEPSPDDDNYQMNYLAQHVDIQHSFDIDDVLFGSDSKNIREHQERSVVYLRELQGVLRHALAILLLYHFPPIKRTIRVPKTGRRIVNGKSRPYFGSEEIKIEWPRRRPINPYKWVRKGLPQTIHKCQHDVDGHWRRVRALRIEEIEALGRPIEELKPHEFYKNVWVKAHKRGDPALGYKRKRNMVTGPLQVTTP